MRQQRLGRNAANLLTAILVTLSSQTSSTLLAEPEVKSPIESGEQFLAYCQSEPVDPYSAIGFGVCLGFIQGVVARETILPEASRAFCLLSGTSWGDEYEIVVGYLRAHPEGRNLPASMLTMAALQQAFPCTKE